MAWGIPGNVGEIYAKQQSDELRDQLLKQEMAQRIRAFEAEQVYRQQQMAAQAEERREREEDRRATRAREARQDTRETARDVLSVSTPGPTTEAVAGPLSAYAGTAPLITRRNVLPSIALGGMSQEDTSGPQNFPVREPTPPELESTRARVARTEAINQLAKNPRFAQLVPLLRAGVIDNPPASAFLPPEVEEFNITTSGPGGQPINKRVTAAQLREGIPGYRAPVAASRTELSPGQALNATMQLRDRYVRETKSARMSQTQLANMERSMEAVRSGAAAPGSQGVLVTFQKILDDLSVVRESEYARSAAGQSILSRIEGAARKAVEGGAGIPPQEMAQFVALAREFNKNQNDQARETRKQINAIATEYGLKPELVTRDYDEPEIAKDGTGTARGGTVIEYDAQGRRKPAPKRK